MDGKYLTFSLGNENYGVKIELVKEIIAMMPITPIPKTPEYIKGILNLRGKIIPIVDLRLKFSMNWIEYNDRTSIIVVEVSKENKVRNVGIAVDKVAEVIDIKTDEIEEFDDDATKTEDDFIIGIAKLKDKVVMLLDIENILASKEIFNMKDTITA
ncbi:MAG: purine-binding chemotaxis protein CheW [Fusobacteria bacterium]|nr:purine-binding chemotaxis protein CheW [Fusobacteriota bacterium]